MKKSAATLPYADKILLIKADPAIVRVGVIKATEEYDGDSCWLDSNMGRDTCTAKEREVLESFIMALVCAGIQDEAKLSEALETTLQSLANRG